MLDVELAIEMGREAAEEYMIDTCVVRRVTSEATDDDGNVTSTYVQVYPDPAWPTDHRWAHGPARRQTYEAQESNPEVGGMVAAVQRYAAHLPVGSFQPQIGDIITWQTSALDPGLPGTVDRVTALLHKTAATAYRLGVEEGGPHDPTG